ncbi:threonine/serine ThrE exporter family protein [Dyella soli]|uniref:Threonine/serine exporter family protein n=1 Tax=Dyella soli TaxID=522319 RepID=A0A4R0YMQ6_9GAMM|nr:threonine/serine exporter family protein [Dyella soli]TCI10167.1 hypothetical protein EZM97_14730 [Dyella soli]
MKDASDCSPSGTTGNERDLSLDTIAFAAALLFANGQTTERTVASTERLGRSFGLNVRVLPQWGELTVEVERTLLSDVYPIAPLGVDMGRVIAVSDIVEKVVDQSLPRESAHSLLERAGQLHTVSTLRFVLFAALGAAALGVIFGALEIQSLLLIALSAGVGAFARRWLGRHASNPFAQPLAASAIAGLLAAIVIRTHASNAATLVAFCPCMVLIPGPHILNGAIDLARTRISLGISRLAYAGVLVLLICVGLLAGLAAGGVTFLPSDSPVAVPFVADVVAAGLAVASFGTFFSMSWRLLPIPIGIGMLAHAVRWALIAFAGVHVTTAALVACLLVGVIITPVVDRLQLPFAALAFSAVVSMMPGYYLFESASALLRLVSSAPQASTMELLTGVVRNGTTAFLVVLFMTIGLILPRMLLERYGPARTRRSAPL